MEKFKKFLVDRFFKTDLALAMATAIIFSSFLCLAGFDADCEKLRQGVLRLHIIANSDSAFDQNIKLEIRDEILKSSGEIFSTAENKADALVIAKENINILKNAADKVLKEKGLSQPVSVTVGKAYFGTRDYEDFTLPAGEYDAVKVKIGGAKGKNWWCVMFPSMCIPAAENKNTLDSAVESDAAEIALSPNEYRIRFKVVEWYEELKTKFKKWFCD